jgi:hypothetical protein
MLGNILIWQVQGCLEVRGKHFEIVLRKMAS